MSKTPFKILTWLIVLSALALLAACSPPQPAKEAPAAAAPAAEAPIQAAPLAAPLIPTPKIVRHAAPELSSSAAAFQFGGCEGANLACPPETTIGMLGCERVTPRDLVGGLNPPTPVAWCVVEYGRPATPELFTYAPGPPPYWRAHLAMWDGNVFELIPPERVKSLFAPIENEDEALSYALLMTDLQMRHDLAFNPKAIYLTNSLEDTNVTKTPTGYLVHLFQTSGPFGCGDHTISAVDVEITTDGIVTQKNPVPQWQEYLCDH